MFCSKVASAATVDDDFGKFGTIKMTYLKFLTIPYFFVMYIGSHELEYAGRDSSISKLTVTVPRGPLL